MTQQPQMSQGLSYDDVLVAPNHSAVKSRSDVSVSTILARDIELDVPLVASPMDTITGPDLVTALSQHGGTGIIHRFQSVSDQVDDVQESNGVVGGAVGITGDWDKRAQRLVESGVDYLCVDTAFGHQEQCINTVERLSEMYPDVPLIAGNVATENGAMSLGKAGADAIRVGIGPGSHCKTRTVAGVGVPQITAIQNARRAKSRLNGETSRGQRNSQYNFRIIADGGIRQSGDIVKALVAGADSVMIGGMFGNCREAAGDVYTTSDGTEYRKTRGMASDAAREDAGQVSGGAEEGVVQETEVKYSVEELVSELIGGVRSGISYTGALNLYEAREYGELIQVSGGTQNLNSPHSEW